MEILEYFSLPAPQQEYWTARMMEGDWRAAPYLANQLRAGTFQDRYGPNGRVFLLTQADALVSFCTLVRRDEIPSDTLMPWIGFVYTFPAFRGHPYSETVIRHACATARNEGHKTLYLSSDEEGLYEKYGFTFCGFMETFEGHRTQVFYRDL